jgi:hypothetical protein
MYQDGAAGKCSTILGYWRQSAAGRGSMDVEHKRKHGSLLPWPVALGEKWDGQDEFCAEVELLCSIVKTPTRFMGFSRCRICQQPNGSREYRSNDYCITEGYPTWCGITTCSQLTRSDRVCLTSSKRARQLN